MASYNYLPTTRAGAASLHVVPVVGCPGYILRVDNNGIVVSGIELEFGPCRNWPEGMEITLMTGSAIDRTTRLINENPQEHQTKKARRRSAMN